jgi:hypothetical protein
MNNLSVAWQPISELVEHPKNPNQHSREQIERLAKLIKYQGWRHPIIVSTRSGYIVAGHGRLAAARLMGANEVPVVRQDFRDDVQEYTFLTSDNAIHEWSILNMNEIDETIKALGEFDHELLGLKNFNMNFNEPEAKKEPEDKEAELKSCPNCGVMIDG